MYWEYKTRGETNKMTTPESETTAKPVSVKKQARTKSESFDNKETKSPRERKPRQTQQQRQEAKLEKQEEKQTKQEAKELAKEEKKANKKLTAAELKKIFIGGFNLLDKHKEYIDSLNVFPVPDGDTGINMTLTMKSVIKELDITNTNEIGQLADAISKGALKGARGNSGVIMSQILKGMMSEINQARTALDVFDTKAFAKAIESGAKVAYQAVTVPKEGTMLTVIRVMGEEAKKIAKRHDDFLDFLDRVIRSGEDILAQTPEMLPQLKKAGVVDAGGRGLLVMFSGFLSALKGEGLETEIVFTTDTVAAGSGDESGDGEADFSDLAEIEFAYCTEFNITNMQKSTTLAAIDNLREKLMKLGDSVVCVGDLAMAKAHVHTNTPGDALSAALQLGEIINIKIENMLQQNRDLRAARKIPDKEQGIVSVAAGEGIISIFKDLGVDYVIKGGQTMNPSAEDIAKAADRVHAKTVFVFPNNKNVILAAKHAQHLVDKNLVVIPSKSINEGIAACIAFNAEASSEENTEIFLSAIESVKSGSVTYAVRNTKMNRFEIKEGEILGLDNKTIVAKGKTPSEVTQKLIEKMITPETVNITLFFGEDVREKDAYALQDKLAAKYPNCEINTVNGGQPVYYYLISLE